MSKVYKVWSADRKSKKLVKHVSGEGLRQFIKNGREKLGYDDHERVSLVLDYDGTSVEDEEYFNTLPPLTRLMFIRDGEKWSNDPAEGSYDQPDTGSEKSPVSGDMEQTLLMLRQDITKIITLNKEELQNMVDFDKVKLAHYLNVSPQEVVRIQDKCQRYLDELEDSQEALELLRIIKDAKQTSHSLTDNSQEGSTSQSHQTDGQPTRKKTKPS